MSTDHQPSRLRFWSWIGGAFVLGFILGTVVGTFVLVVTLTALTSYAP